MLQDEYEIIHTIRDTILNKTENGVIHIIKKSITIEIMCSATENITTPYADIINSNIKFTLKRDLIVINRGSDFINKLSVLNALIS